ncbi:MAG: hypothetical protein F4091_04195 [Acidimicrobiales bacterium]|nr:hypothetical protein [Acidimicrobiales bacterium]MYD82894.1 hypothetical protein [Acidimicrobiales bacterium]MYJ64656.1 hypothetical protein [Acidimicrobiales bacterium]
MTEIELQGLPGSNPLAYMAALGIQSAFDSESRVPLLRWSEGLNPVAYLTTELDSDAIIEQVLVTAKQWSDEPALNPVPVADDVKFPSDAIRGYLRGAMDSPSKRLAMALVAEGSLDAVTGKVAKPTDFHFTAGRQLFLQMARKILTSVTTSDIASVLQGPWKYDSRLPSLRWDVADDRAYALSAFDPTDNTNNPKMTNAGAECLAVLGLCRFPVFVGTRKTATTGCSGTWRNGIFAWPLWNMPASPEVVRTLLAHVDGHRANEESFVRCLSSLGIFRIMASPIRRNDRAMGLANFGPPEVLWQRD